MPEYTYLRGTFSGGYLRFLMQNPGKVFSPSEIYRRVWDDLPLNADNALAVRFPKLREGKVYEVAVSDYVYRNYKDLNYTDGKLTGTAVAGVLLEELQDDGPLTPDNRPRQKIIRNS